MIYNMHAGAAKIQRMKFATAAIKLSRASAIL
jgi:hypothetical protein